MRLPKFEYQEPKTLKEAAKTLASGANGSVLISGGTDLMVNMKHRVIQPKQLINLKTIPNLAYISNGKGGLRIGTLTTLHDIASSSVIQEKIPILCQASREVGAYAHQAMGTLGGNLCQGNRCRFYNQSAFWRGVRPPCYKAGGSLAGVFTNLPGVEVLPNRALRSAPDATDPQHPPGGVQHLQSLTGPPHSSIVGQDHMFHLHTPPERS